MTEETSSSKMTEETSSSKMTEEKKTIVLRSGDGEIFEVAQEAALQCETIKNIIEDGCTLTEKGIPLPNVSGKILSKVIEYLNHHMKDHKGKGKDGEEEEKKAEKDLTKWDEKFVEVDWPTLFDITLAADYLNVKNLLDMTCLTIANHMTNKSLEEIWKIFGIEKIFRLKKRMN
ncbi:hypothetical protein AMTRI_Chr07g76030 [Amborella trichopoda]